MPKQFREDVNSIVDSVAKLGDGAKLIHATKQKHTIPMTKHLRKQSKRRR